MTYDPKTYWNDKARRATSPVAAVCRSDPASSRNIDAVQRRLLQRAFARIARDVPLAGRRALDYGCGVGRLAPFIEQVGCRYSGVDIADEMIDRARAFMPGRDFQCLQEGRIPHGDGAFDLVLSVGVVHHNPYDEQQRILSEFARVLRPDGRLVLFEAAGPRVTGEHTEFARPVDDWIAFVESYGFACLGTEGCRYFLARAASRWLAHALRLHSTTERAPDWVEALGICIDPVLGPLLPRDWQNRAALVFARRPELI